VWVCGWGLSDCAGIWGLGFLGVVVGVECVSCLGGVWMVLEAVVVRWTCGEHVISGCGSRWGERWVR